QPIQGQQSRAASSAAALVGERLISPPIPKPSTDKIQKSDTKRQGSRLAPVWTWVWRGAAASPFTSGGPLQGKLSIEQSSPHPWRNLHPLGMTVCWYVENARTTRV
ncbi:hypothetical protein, partial [Pararhizobium haloflavum]|uniref:hypothetical protein n=1 Tax=Pararhizobium haloflavum TaxID=2037914 RepID=UPI001AED01E5